MCVEREREREREREEMLRMSTNYWFKTITIVEIQMFDRFDIMGNVVAYLFTLNT